MSLFYLVLVLLIMGGALVALLWVGTLFFQGYIYSEPAGELYWRAPAAAGALTLVLTVWCLLNYRAIDPNYPDLPYDTLFSMTSSEKASPPVDEFDAVPKAGGRLHYRLRWTTSVPPRPEYYDDEHPPHRWSAESDRNVTEIIVLERGRGEDRPHEVHFKASPAGSGRFVEEGGRRYMTSDYPGQITTPGNWVTGPVTILLNVLHLAAWFVGLWLLLRFQWPHALGLAVVLWLTMTLAVIPQLLTVTKAAAQHKAAPPNALTLQIGADLTGRLAAPPCRHTIAAISGSRS